LTYYLPFERFLNPYRPTPPDIDLDVSDDKREELIGYIVSKYGKDKVAQICTFGRMLARAAVRDVARVLGYPYATGDRISKMIPPPKQGFPIDINKALVANPMLKELYDGDADAKRILDLAHHVEGSARHVSVHAAGVVVAQSVLTDFTPLQLEPKGDKVITQYEMHGSEDVGLIKFDILGIRNLAILGAAVKIVEETLGIKVDLRSIPLDDKKTFEMLGKGDTMGTFQMGGGGMTKYLKDLKPTRVEDLMAMVALYRPGPMAVIPEYIARKRNPKKVKYLDPRMEKFLQASYGLIVYQDDLLFCAIDLAGYSWEEADKFRKAVGKKIPEEMAAQKEKFCKGIIAKGQTEEFAETLWKLFEPFQSYGFNKAHAASYGMIAYQTAYMKANFPVEYMTALLTAESNDTDKISQAINECRRMGIKVLPPDINQSEIGFKVIEDKESLGGRAIRFGLSAVKNVGDAAIEAILDSRKEGEFLSMHDFLARTDARRVNKKVLESLIKVGAFGSFGKRASLLASIDTIRAKVIKKDKDEQQGLFGGDEIKKTIMTSANDYELIQVAEFSDQELEDLERQLLGFSVSGKSILEVIAPFSHLATHKVHDIGSETVGEDKVKIAGVLREVRTIITKKSAQEMAFAKIEDDTGTLNLVIFPKLFAQTKDYWLSNKAVLVIGKVDSRDDEFSLLVDTAHTNPEEAGKSRGEVMIKIPKDTSTEQLKNLKKLFLSSPGKDELILVFEGKGNKVKASMTISWNPNLARQISEILRSSLS
jgi:DNA polymerase-3 subunit alpha